MEPGGEQVPDDEPLVAAPDEGPAGALGAALGDLLAPLQASAPDRVAAHDEAIEREVAAAEAVLRALFADDEVRRLHLERLSGSRLVVRARRGGVLRPAPCPVLPAEAGTALLRGLKRLANLDPHERLRPRTGRGHLEATAARPPLGFEVSTLQTTRGETALVERVEAPARTGARLEGLGLDPTDLGRARALLEEPQGLVLVAALRPAEARLLFHAALSHLALDPARTVQAITDMPEFARDDPELDAPPALAPGIVEVTTRPEYDLTQAVTLRAVLRAGDPDVVGMGAIWDLETASLLVDAAQDRLVVTTLFVQDAARALVRLTDMGLEAYRVAAAITLVVAARALPRLCDACKRRVAPPHEDDRRRLAPRLVDEELLDGWEVGYAPRRGGCEACDGRGVRGTVRVFEVLARPGAAFDRLARGGTGGPALPPGPEALQALYARTRTLREAALLRVAAGQVALVDALRRTPGAPA
jgi:type II secretory ATPase GspE/PulE/Tfp pilus assembly ATPase PilB-like protein